MSDLPINSRGYACWAIMHDGDFRERYIFAVPNRYDVLRKLTSRRFDTKPESEKWWYFIGVKFWGHHLTTNEERKAIVEEFLIWKKSHLLLTGSGIKSAR